MTGYRNAHTRGNASSTPQDDGFQAQAERLSRKVGESAQHVWLAGLGALGRAQHEGGRIFDTLVREGASYDRRGRRYAEAGADAVRDEVEERIDQARDAASDGWQKLGKAFDERVKKVLHGLKIPNRDELDALRAEVASLRVRVQAAEAAARRKTRPRPTSRGPASAGTSGSPDAPPTSSGPEAPGTSAPGTGAQGTVAPGTSHL